MAAGLKVVVVDPVDGVLVGVAVAAGVAVAVPVGVGVGVLVDLARPGGVFPVPVVLAGATLPDAVAVGMAVDLEL